MRINVEMLSAFLTANNITIDELAKFIRRVRQRKRARKKKDPYDNGITIDDVASQITDDLLSATTLLTDGFVTNFDCVSEEDRKLLLYSVSLFIQAIRKFRTHANNSKEQVTTNLLDTNTVA